jgi:hypothetical protein
MLNYMKMKRTPVLEVTGYRRENSPHAGVAPLWVCELRYAGLPAAGHVLHGKESITSNDSSMRIWIEPTRTGLEISNRKTIGRTKILNLIVIPTGKFQTKNDRNYPGVKKVKKSSLIPAVAFFLLCRSPLSYYYAAPLLRHQFPKGDGAQGR